jgi:glyoxylase I family protein
MKLESFHHIALIVSDYKRSKDFYTQVLGFKVEAENYRAERDSYKLDLVGASGMRLELFSFPTSPARPTRPEACGLRHLAFQVGDLERAVAHLVEFSVACEPIRIDEYTGKRFTFFSDPDGLPLELYEVSI